jgi:hypothetical protein
MNNNELYHYGVLGMKWGVRRSKAQLDRIGRKATKNGWSDDAKTAAEIKTKNVKQMSNSELKKLNERIRLEREYSNLTTRQKSAGEKFVSDIARETAKDTVKSYTTKYAKQGIDWAINNLK